MNVTVQEWENDTLGRFALVKLGVVCGGGDSGSSDGVPSLVDGLAARPPLNVTLVLDVSGSMAEHMAAVVRTALGAVDVLGDGASLRVITFDNESREVLPRTAVDASNRERIKDTLRASIVNRGGMTNLEHALVLALNAPHQSVLLMTDGTANVGCATTSAQLTALVRALPAYAGCVVHALGVQAHAGTGLNAGLLKTAAIDTSGSFSVASDAEALTAFLGDVLAEHAMRAYENVRVRCFLADGTEAVAELPAPLMGYRVRHDRPTSIIVRLPAAGEGRQRVARIEIEAVHAAARAGASVQAAEAGAGAEAAEAGASVQAAEAGAVRQSVVITAPCAPLTDDDVAAIVGCAVTELMAPSASAGARQAALDAIKALVPTHTTLAPILMALSAAAAAPPAGPETGVHVAQALALFSAVSNAPSDTPAMITARHLTRTISSRQDPHGSVVDASSVDIRGGGLMRCAEGPYDATRSLLLHGGGGGGGGGAGLPPLRPCLGMSLSVGGLRSRAPVCEPSSSANPSVVTELHLSVTTMTVDTDAAAEGAAAADKDKDA